MTVTSRPADELAACRARLLRLRAELEGAADAADESTRTVELDQAKIGRLSRMDALQGQQMAMEAARRRERLLAGIDGALRRIADGDYGYCFTCGEPIDPRRLQADPTVTRCIACQQD